MTFDDLTLRASRAASPGDETVAVFPDGEALPATQRTLARARRDWFGRLAPVGTVLTKRQMENVTNQPADRDSFVFGGSEWRKAKTGKWEKVK